MPPVPTFLVHPIRSPLNSTAATHGYGAALALLISFACGPVLSAPHQTPELQEAPKLASKQPIKSERLDPLPLPERFRGKGALTPKSASPATTPAATCSYTIVAGDTLSTIASRQLGNMSRWPEIARLNKLTGFSVIHPGQLLQMPCATSGKGPITHGTPLLAPALVWTARPGEHLTDVISRWARKAGYTVVQDGSDEWEVDVPISLRGDFKDALESLIRGFEASGRPLAISLYSNKIIRIGSPL